VKSWTGKALETVNCFAFLKCKLTVVIRVGMLTANLKLINKKSLIFFFAMFSIKNRIANDSYSRSKYQRF
jgi:hypothetical protein